MSQGNYPQLSAGWKTVPLKHAVSINPEVLPDSTHPETLLSYVDIAALENGVAELAPTEVTFAAAPSRARRVLRGGDTILSTVRTYLKAVASFPEVEANLIASTGFAVLRPNGSLHPRFAYWAALSEPFIENVVAHSDGVSYPAINPTLLGNLPVAVPPLTKQECIANFLDDKTARIDALIAEKEELVERLFEYRLSVATSAITQGLPGAHTEFVVHPFLGSIPKNWRTGKFRHYVQFRSGQVDPEDAQYSSMPLIAPNHIESGSGRLLGTETALEQAAESGKYWCDAGDVIYSKIRPALRKATIAPFDCLCSADMYPLKGHMGLTNEFLFWYLLSEPFSVFAVQESVRVAMPKLNRETLANAAVPLPPYAEQLAIVSYIREKTASVDSVIEHATEHIARLREYRSSLISAAVTGQMELGVTEVAA